MAAADVDAVHSPPRAAAEPGGQAADGGAGDDDDGSGFSFVDPRPANEVLWDKAAAAAAALAPVCGGVPLAVVPSPVDRWRQRCRFSVAHLPCGRVGFYLETDAAGAPVLIDAFPIASESVDAAMRLLRAHLSGEAEGAGAGGADGSGAADADAGSGGGGVSGSGDSPLTRGLCMVGVHGTRVGPPPRGDVCVSLFYDRPLDPGVWTEAADALRAACGLSGVVGRAKGQRVVSGRDYVVETLRTADGREHRYRQTEGHFSNPNSHVAELTLDWLCDRSREIARESSATSDLLEMFCGNGNHTLALAGCGAYRSVLGVEINAHLVSAAKRNIADNGLEAVCDVVRAPSAKFVTKVLKTWAGHAQARRRAAAGAQGTDGAAAKGEGESEGEGATEATHVVSGRPYRFRTVLVDPPRAGLDDATRSHVRRYRSILYISCNPAALRRDIEGLSATHAVRSGAIFDHFPRTPHLETAVHLAARECWHDPCGA